MKKFSIYVVLAIAAALPALVMRVAGFHLAPVLDTLLFGVAILGAGFLLSWGAEAAEGHVSQGLALAVLALVTVLPEYAVDVYYTLQAGRHPDSHYVEFAAANMTGANRLLIGMAWPLIVLLFWWRSGKRAVPLSWENSAEISYLALASIYSFVITLKGRIDLFDTFFLAAIFAAYLWRVSKLPKSEDDDDDDDEVGPATALRELPKRLQYAIMAALTIVAAGVILAVAQPFAESLIATGEHLGINKFLLIQWVAPLAGEAPEIIICVLFTLSLKPRAALGALISDKINQWTLLVGFIPLFYSIGAGHLSVFPLDARQHEEFFLTAAQSLFAVALLLRLRLSLPSALVLLGLFGLQIGLAFAFHSNEARSIEFLNGLAWVYLVLAALLLAWNRVALAKIAGIGLLNRPLEAEKL
ncbi:sodium:proton exchanger [Abditibacterium utsteinense]|nr:sodium:proton exchanger [Abditibacterium utsteinense]